MFFGTRVNFWHGRPRLAHRLRISRAPILSGLSLIVMLGLACQNATAKQAREHLERLAGKLQLLSTGDFLYDRIGSRFQSDSDRKILSELMATSYPETALIELLKHDSPTVRTLALVCLFATENQKVLPDMIKMVDDQAETFPRPVPVAVAVSSKIESLPTEPQTVGQVAEQMVRFYMERAGYGYGVKGSSNCPEFDDYWAKHKVREYNASWFAVQTDRATQGTSPIPSGREDKFQALRQRIDRLPNPDRSWYLLFVGTHEGGDRVVSTNELIDIAKTLGHDQLLLLLARRVPIGDPDLFQAEKPQGCGGYDWIGGMMVKFTLEHAKELLHEKDAEFLLNSPFRDDSDSHWAIPSQWVIAAATLRPDSAERTLKNGMSHLSERNYGWDKARLAATLYQIAGENQLDFILDWFYNEPLRSNMTTAHQIFIQEVSKSSDKEARQLLARLIKDPRFESLNREALTALLMTVNEWLPQPLVENPYLSIPDERIASEEWKKLLRESIAKWDADPKSVGE